MKDHLAQLVAGAVPAARRNVVREYLQARLLSVLQRAGAMVPLAFHGGTALRFLYALPRYSEDLDFALERPRQGYELRAWLRAARAALEREGYSVEIKVSERRVVHGAFVRFPGLLHEMALSPHRGEILAVKIEVDTRPPAGAGLETTVVRRHVTLRLQHHDRPSLLAGKLHAVLQRPFTKGRDLYDLLWYLSDPTWPPPNLTLLNNALAQTGWSGPEMCEQNWRRHLGQCLEQLDFRRAVADVRPFLASADEADLLTLENLKRALTRR